MTTDTTQPGDVLAAAQIGWLGDLERLMSSAGMPLENVSTGGGCTALAHRFRDGWWLHLTDGDSNAPGDPCDLEPGGVYIHLVDPDGYQLDSPDAWIPAVDTGLGNVVVTVDGLDVFIGEMWPEAEKVRDAALQVVGTATPVADRDNPVQVCAEFARSVDAAQRELEESQRRRDHAIRAALEAGAGVREIARATGLSASRVSKIGRTGHAEGLTGTG